MPRHDHAMNGFLACEREAVQDWPAVASWLRTQGLALDTTRVRQFASGVANLNYLVSVNGQRAVLRRPPAGPLPPGAYDLTRQHRVMSRLPPHFPYTPRALAYCTDTGVIGVPFLVVEYREGVAIGKALPDSMRGIPDVGDALSRLMVESLAELHAIDPAAAGLADLGRPEGFNERQVHGWRKRAALVMEGDALQAVHEITDWLLAHLPAERPARILHLDYKLDNVLVDPATLTIAGVVDWEMATLGDPMFDLALMLVVWGQPGDSDHRRRNSCAPSDAPGWWTRRQALAAYLARSGQTLGEADLKFFWLLAELRNCVACAQLVALYRREHLPNASSLDLADVVATGLAYMRRLIHEPLDW
jgi:aminoglycoside phosphotransferase (APT) family kinase protein